MDAKEFQDILYSILLEDEVYEVIKSIRNFQDAGFLTNDKGLVIKLKDGSEFQVTIVQNK